MPWPPFLQRLFQRVPAGGPPQWVSPQGSETNHVVQFYGGSFPAAGIADFLREGIERGERGVVIATAEHCEALKQALGPLKSECRFLHAGRALNQFMVGGRPDPARFDEAIGSVVRDLAKSGNGHVRAYGEMVVELCRRGNPEGAVALERAWNRLGETHGFTLLCSYPMDVFTGDNRRHLVRLREQHRHALVA